MKLNFIPLLLICLHVSGQSPKEKKTGAYFDSLLDKSKYNEAFSYALKEYQRLKTPLSKARSLFAEFKIEESKKRIKEASAKMNEAIMLLKNKKDLSSDENTYLVSLYDKYADFLSEADLKDEALKRMKECYGNPGFKKAGEKEKSRFLHNYAKLLANFGDTFESMTIYEELLPLAGKAFGRISNEVALIYNDFAETCFNAYLSKEALDLNNKALDTWSKVADKNISDFITACQNSVYYQVEYGDLKEAKKINQLLSKTYFDHFKGEKAKEMEGYRSSRRDYILGNVRVYAALNETKSAELFIDSLKKEELSIQNKTDKEGINYILGAYQSSTYQYYDTYRFRECIKYTLEALALARKYDFPFYVMAFEAQLATSYEKLKDYASGLSHIRKAQLAYEFQGFSSSKFSLQMIEAMCYDGLNNVSRSTEITGEALGKIIREKAGKNISLEKVSIEDVKSLNSYSFINIFTTGARIYWFSYQKTGNKRDLQIAENLFILSARMFQNYYLKGEFNNYINYLHLRIAEGLLSVGTLTRDAEKLKHMINLIEVNASQHLLKEFNKKLKVFNPERRDLTSAINRCNAEIDFYAEKLNGEKDKKEKQIISRKLEDLKKRKTELQQKIEQKEKNYAVFNTADFEVDKILEVMDDDQQILKYYVADRHTFLLSLTKGNVSLYQLAENEALKTRVTEYGQELKLIKPGFSKHSAFLHEVLLKNRFKKHVTVIPDNILNYIPFESLYNAREKAFFGQKNIVSYDYSLPLWLLRQQKPQASFKHSLAVFSPAYAAEHGSENRGSFKNLKYAKKESEVISSLYKGDIYLGEAATKGKFLESLDQYKVFHLSMHSLLFEEDFNESCLIFSNDQRLYFSELYGMEIPSEMVVLSACETGSGKLIDGEGVMSLARSLSYAGVQSAVVSLWQIPDKETSEIMISFYENLKKGMGKDVALAQAKVTFIANNPMKNHPYYWAGFILNGNVAPVSSETNWYLYSALGFALATMSWFFRKRLFQFGK